MRRTRSSSSAPCGHVGSGRKRWSESLVAPWEEPGGQRHEEARGWALVVDANTGERHGQRGVQREPVKADAGSGARRVEVLPACDSRQRIDAVNMDVIPEGIAFDRRFIGR